MGNKTRAAWKAHGTNDRLVEGTRLPNGKSAFTLCVAALVEGSDNAIAVSCLCASCGAGKSEGEITGIVTGFYRDKCLGGDLEIGGPDVSGQQH